MINSQPISDNDEEYAWLDVTEEEYREIVAQLAQQMGTSESKEQTDAMKVKRVTQERALEMYNELLEHKLEVVLIPAPDPRHTCHYIRVAQNQPPDWFSELARRHMRSSKRAPKLRPNFIKRELTLRALAAIAAGKVETTYAKRWHREIERHLANEMDRMPF